MANITKKKSKVKDIIGKFANSDEKDKKKNFELIFNAIVDTYKLDNVIDQLIANRAATQLVNLQNVQALIKQYGLTRECTDQDGNLYVRLNELAYYSKTLEAEFRANIRMLQQSNIKQPPKKGDINNFSEWVKG